MIKGSYKSTALKTAYDLMTAADIITGKAKTRANQDLIKDAIYVFNNPKGLKGLSPMQVDQIKAKLLTNPSLFRAWGYFNMAKRIADRLKSGEDLLAAITGATGANEDADIATGPFRPPQWNGLPTEHIS